MRLTGRPPRLGEAFQPAVCRDGGVHSAAGTWKRRWCLASEERDGDMPWFGVDGRSTVIALRGPPILEPGAARPTDVVGRYHTALEAGDVEAVVNTFAPDGYYREPIGSALHAQRHP
jgi:hypothetical protein